MPHGPVRRERERLYRERPAEIVRALQILAKSQKPVLAEFGRRWLEDYRLWVEHQRQEQAA